ncbi:transcriptional regulator SirC [Salmonella enterica]|nr:transcriptional regulator SirC [Salmonella enterica]EEN5901345.1 transcriptional regulator SirC [Salmonella enterica]
MVLPSMNKSVEAISNNHLQQPNKFPLINGLADVRDYYVANCLLFKLNKGSLRIENEFGEFIEQSAPCLFLLEKDQTITLSMSEIEGHIDFSSLEVSYDLMQKFYKVFYSTRNYNDRELSLKTKPKYFFHADLLPGMSDTFDSILHGVACPRVCSNVSIDDHDYSYFSLMYLISAFVRKPGGFDFLERAIKITTKEKVYNIIISDLTRKWSQAEVAGKLFMSISSLKRKLAAEEVSFSKIYLDARMNQAIKLLRMGAGNISQVATMCGYDTPSYFIAIFKRHFKITPLSFMRTMNH